MISSYLDKIKELEAENTKLKSDAKSMADYYQEVDALFDAKMTKMLTENSELKAKLKDITEIAK